jgi:tRNA-uridine 2-sulfurtransferase
MKKVVVGLSGGVDSSVAALLLIEQGYEVVGVFMKNWHNTDVTISDDCPWEEDSKDALLVAEKLGIPFQTLDLSIEYKKRIVDYMFDEYQAGRTPNPDILCNREIKFDVFLKAALALGADYVATGHYCRKASMTKNGVVTYKLLSGLDSTKDQSYFLCQMDQHQLSKALFPIGDMLKKDVRKMAAEHDLVTADKKDSQGLCFIGKVRLPDFLQQKLKAKKGRIIEIAESHPYFATVKGQNGDYTVASESFKYDPSMGEIIGEHNGAHFYTIGQRKGLRVGGKAEPIFVLQTDVVNNIVYVGMGENHPGLYRSALFIKEEDAHWVRPDADFEIGATPRYQCRIRYRQALQGAELHRTENGYYIAFDKPQKAIAAGQFAAWYQEQELMGSGVIYS